MAGLAALVGAVVVARGSHWFLSLYFALMLALILLTPWPEQFWRYLAPLTPLTLAFALAAGFVGVRFLSRYGTRWGQAGVVFVVLSTLGMLLIQLSVAVYFLRTLLPISYYDASGHERNMRLLTYSKQWHSLDSAFEWLRIHAVPEAVIATVVPQLGYLRSGRKAVLPPFESDHANGNRLLDELPVEYLVVDQFDKPGITEHYVRPLVNSEPEKWKLVFTAPDGRSHVYERIR